MQIITSIKDKVTHAIAMRVTDEESLKASASKHVNTSSFVL
jgi:hypothetical protein